MVHFVLLGTGAVVVLGSVLAAVWKRRGTRPWPAVGVLTGAALIAAAAATVPREAQELSALQPTYRPPSVVIAFEPTPAPTPLPEDTPEPEQTQAPTEPASSGPTTAPRRAPAGAGTTPGPSPSTGRGPSVASNAFCSRGVASLDYTVTARPETTLSSLRVTLDGETVQEPSVGGRASHQGTYRRTVGPGPHTFTITTTGSDGGTTVTSSRVSC